MKKTILSLAILLASSAGITAIAQTPAQQAQKANSTEIKAPKGERPQALDLFQGLNLTEQQKAQLKDLKPEVPKEKRAEMMAKHKADRQKQLEERKKARSEYKAKEKARKQEQTQQRKQARRDYLAKVKAILTPEQYIQFLENNFVDLRAQHSPKASKTKVKVRRVGTMKKVKSKGVRKEGQAPQNGNAQGADKK